MDAMMFISIWALIIIGSITIASYENDIPVARIFMGILIIIGSVTLTIGAIKVGNNNGYTKGQIDTINGEINYELQTQKDSSVKWVEIKKD